MRVRAARSRSEARNSAKSPYSGAGRGARERAGNVVKFRRAETIGV